MGMALILVSVVTLTACGQESKKETKKEVAKEEQQEVKKIKYLDKEYEFKNGTERIVVTGAMEAMEDAAALDVTPVGAITVAGKFPEIYGKSIAKSESIGEKQQPNFETILSLKPDVILGTTKFPEEVVKKLEEIAPTILVSHISSDWKDNLQLMGDLSGKRAEADKKLAAYEADVEKNQETLKKKFGTDNVLMLRIRGGQMFIYPENVFFNPSLYNEIGLAVPEVVKQAKAQEEITVEQLAKVNPEHLFIQVQSTGDKQENEKAYEELKKNPIMQQITAFKNDHVYVNAVDSLLEGGTLFSKEQFLEAVQNLDKK